MILAVGEPTALGGRLGSRRCRFLLVVILAVGEPTALVRCTAAAGRGLLVVILAVGEPTALAASRARSRTAWTML